MVKVGTTATSAIAIPIDADPDTVGIGSFELRKFDSLTS
jgi:hypothetical protein